MESPDLTDSPADRPVVPDRLRLPFTFEPARLAADLALVGGAWTPHYVKQNYDGDWSVIPLRAPQGETHPIRMIYSDPSQPNYVDTDLLRAAPYFREVLASFETRLFAARLMRLAPGSVIKEHTDVGLEFEEGMARVHVPVLTNPDVEFVLNGSRVVLEAGSCWYLRLADPHRVANRGTTDRVHLVVDMKVNGWLSAVVRAAR